MPGSAQGSSIALSGSPPGTLAFFFSSPVGRIVRFVIAIRLIARTV
jgi:hypothetical protein